MIVLKFGGSSVDGPAGMARVAAIVHRLRHEHPVVVVSAMGKTTRRLVDCGEAAAAGSLAEALQGASELESLHREVAAAAVPAASAARMATAIDSAFAALRSLLERLAERRFMAPPEADALTSLGEVVASEMLALALPGQGIAAEWIDARQVIVTDDAFTRAHPAYDETEERLHAAIAPVLARGAVPVVGGYIGATADGAVTTLGKEGSDFTAAIVGGALGASEVQLWTDVDGILTGDPRWVPAAALVPALSFAEALELACSGMKKPHPGTLEAAGRRGVPIRVLNSHTGSGSGTVIGPLPSRPAAAGRIRSLACRPNDHLLHVFPDPAGGANFVASVCAVVGRLRPALLVLRLDGDGAHLALDRAERLDEVRAALGAAAGIGEIGVLHGRAAVSLVSDDLLADDSLLAATLAAAGDLQPRLVTAGAAAATVRGLTEMEDLPAVMARLHNLVFAGGLP